MKNLKQNKNVVELLKKLNEEFGFRTRLATLGIKSNQQLTGEQALKLATKKILKKKNV